MGGWTLWMVDINIFTIAINALWVDSWPRPKSNGRGENHLGRRVPSSQTSLYRLLWGECHMFTDLSLQVALVGKEFRASAKFTDPPLQVPSLPISLYRSLPIGRWKKNKNKKQDILLNSNFNFGFWFQCIVCSVFCFRCWFTLNRNFGISVLVQIQVSVHH